MAEETPDARFTRWLGPSRGDFFDPEPPSFFQSDADKDTYEYSMVISTATFREQAEPDSGHHGASAIAAATGPSTCEIAHCESAL